MRIQECHGLVGVMVTALILGIHLLSHATWATVWRGRQRSFAWEGAGACGAHLCQGVWVRCQPLSFVFFPQYFVCMSRLNHMDLASIKEFSKEVKYDQNQIIDRDNELY